jgi:Protein of unknown function (DUF1360)
MFRVTRPGRRTRIPPRTTRHRHRPRRRGAPPRRREQEAIGELLTCPFCVDLWMATALIAGQIFLPRPTRLAIDTFATLAGADMLQFVYAWLQRSAS